MLHNISKIFFRVKPTRLADPVRLAVNELGARMLPAAYLWSPISVILPQSISWSIGDNWQILSGAKGTYVDQVTSPKLTPGAGDAVAFNGGTPQANSDCVVDVGDGVVVKEIAIYSDFNKSLILTNPLTVSNGQSMFLSNAATIRGSASGTPATRGTLNIAIQSIFEFAKGSFENVSIYVGGDSKLVVDSPSGTRVSVHAPCVPGGSLVG